MKYKDEDTGWTKAAVTSMADCLGFGRSSGE